MPTLIYQGNDVVAVRIGDIDVMSCYVSPNIPREEFLEFLDELSIALTHLNAKILVCGDFNSKSKSWGSPYSDERGITVDEWAAENDLRLLNVGNEPTCIRTQGTSIVDLTWASPGLIRQNTSWQVLNITTLSDHAYIQIEFECDRRYAQPMTTRGKPPRWNWRKADWCKFQDSLLWSCTSNLTDLETMEDAEKMVERLDAEIKMACDNAAKRTQPPKGRKSVYWWSEAIAEARANTNQAYRR